MVAVFCAGDPTPAQGTAAGPEAGFAIRRITVEGRSRSFATYIPDGAVAPRAASALVCLHDRELAGHSAFLALSDGLARAITATDGQWPFVSVFPQLLPGMVEWRFDEPAASSAIDAGMAFAGVAADAPWIGAGWGQGALGVVHCALRRPERWCGLILVDLPASGLVDLAARGESPILLVETSARRERAAEVALCIGKRAARAALSSCLSLPGRTAAQAFADARVAVWAMCLRDVPQLGAALVDPRALRSFAASLRSLEVADTAPAVVRQATLQLEGRGWAWSATDRGASFAAPASAERAGERLSSLGQCLVQARIVDLPERPTPRAPDGILVADCEVTLRITGTDERGAWTFERALPFGSRSDPGLRRALEALEQYLLDWIDEARR